MRFLKTLVLSLIAIVVFVVSLVFALRNSQLVTVDFYLVTFENLSLSIWLFLAFAAGVGVGLLIFSTVWVRLKAKHIGSHRKLTAAKQEVALLKTPTISE